MFLYSHKYPWTFPLDTVIGNSLSFLTLGFLVVQGQHQCLRQPPFEYLTWRLWNIISLLGLGRWLWSIPTTLLVFFWGKFLHTWTHTHINTQLGIWGGLSASLGAPILCRYLLSVTLDILALMPLNSLIPVFYWFLPRIRILHQGLETLPGNKLVCFWFISVAICAMSPDVYSLLSSGCKWPWTWAICLNDGKDGVKECYRVRILSCFQTSCGNSLFVL